MRNVDKMADITYNKRENGGENMLSYYTPKDSYQRNEEPAVINLLTARKVLTDTDRTLIMERTYDNYAIVYAHSGGFCCCVNGEDITLGEGELLFFGKYAKFAIRTDGGRAGGFYVIGFNASDTSCIEPDRSRVRHFAQSSVRRLVCDIYGESKKQHTGRSIAEAYLLALLLTLSNLPDSRSSDCSIYERTTRYIIDNAHLDLRVGDVADALGYNKDYLGRLFLHYGGKTLKKAITEERIAQAKELLASTDYDLNRISVLLNFYSTNTFVKFFKYHTQMTPTEYRRIKQKNERY